MAIAAGVTSHWFVRKPVFEQGTDRASSANLGSSSESTQLERDQNDALRNQVAQLELKVAALTARAASERPNGDPAAAVNPLEANSPTSAELIEHDKAQWEAHMVAVEADFQAEPRDPRWAHSTTNLLRDRAINDKVMRTAVKQVECRSTICRVEMVDDRKGEFERKLPEFLQSLSSEFPTGQASTVESPDGTRTLSVYLSTTSGADAPGSRGG
jgi:hypothetical protein